MAKACKIKIKQCRHELKWCLMTTLGCGPVLLPADGLLPIRLVTSPLSLHVLRHIPGAMEQLVFTFDIITLKLACKGKK